MPLKKKRISELNEANDMKGFYTIGYRIVNGVKTSLKFGLEKIQTALDNMLKATSDAKTATTDMRQLEATVEGNESTRETAESRRNASEQAREATESVRVTNENARKTAETGRSSSETARVTAEGKRVTAETERADAESKRVSDEQTRKSNEDARKTAEIGRSSAETGRVTAEGKRVTAETGRVNAESGRVTAEDKRKAEYGGIIDEMNQATEDATAQLGLVKTATDNANAAATLANQKAILAGEKAALADAAAGSVNAAKDAATIAANNANAAKNASEAQTALAKKATDDANAAKNASVTQTGLAKKATDDANAAAIAANNAVSGVDAKVQAAIDKLVAGAPDALDTLIELANALGNDPNFAATMTTELGKKLNASDIVNNLTSGGAGKVLSAEQGKALKAALDSHNHDSRYEKIITKLTAFNKDFGTAAGTVCQGNDSRLSDTRTPKAHTHKKADISDFPTSMPASDVPAWAKAASKPTYTASEVGASPSGHNHIGTYEPTFTKNSAFNKNFGSAVGTVCEGSDARLSDTRTPKAHTHKKSEISDFPTSMPASDVSAWAKASSKPSYTASEVGASPSNHNHTGTYQPVGNYAATVHKHAASDITEDTTHRFFTDTERSKLNGVAEDANKYVHPTSHPASIIEESTSRKFMTTEEKIY